MPDKFQKFTERARKVLTLAQEEAQRFNHNYIGTEHLLLGLVREEGGVAARVLRNMGVDLAEARARVEFIVGQGDSMIVGELGLTTRAKKVIELAVDEARKLNHHYIGTEHLLLGLIREDEGIGAGVLESLGVRLPEARRQIVQVISQGGTSVGGEMPEGFQRFTDRVRMVLTYAQEEAQRLNHNYIGTEHLLLGLVREGDGVAARVLNNMGVQLPKVRAAVESIIGWGDSMIVGELGLTPRAKKVIELAVDEARKLNHHYIGTEHMLLGLIDEGHGISAGVLESLGVRLAEARRQIMQIIGKGGEVVGGPMPAQPGPVAALGPPLGDLLSVVSIAQTQAAGDDNVTLLSLESYAHGFIIHCRVIFGDQPPFRTGRVPDISRFRALEFDVIDDRGGHYDGHMQSGGVDARAWYLGSVYRPAVDPEARELRVRVRAGNGGPAGPPASSVGPETAPPPPWLFTFSILLHPEGR